MHYYFRFILWTGTELDSPHIDRTRFRLQWARKQSGLEPLKQNWSPGTSVGTGQLYKRYYCYNTISYFIVLSPLLAPFIPDIVALFFKDLIYDQVGLHLLCGHDAKFSLDKCHELVELLLLFIWSIS